MEVMAHTIDQLNPENENTSVLGRVCRKWQPRNTKSSTPIRLDLILIDEKGDQIHVQIPKKHEDKNTTQIHEQQVYKFTNFRIKDAPQDYNPVKNTMVIEFTSTTTVEPTPGKENIMKDKFHFIKEDEIPSLWNKRQLLYGKYNISASSATKIIVQPDIPDAHHIKQGTTEQESQKLTQSNNIAPTHTDIKEVTLQELQKKREQEENKDTSYYVSCTIIAVRDGWNYIGCLDCMRKVEDITDENKQSPLPQNDTNQSNSEDTQHMSQKKYHCVTCKKTTTKATRRYQVKLNVADNSGEAGFVLLDYEGERFFNIPAAQLYNKDDGDRLPNQILNMMGRRYQFKIKLTKNNISNPYGDYAISKIVEHPEDTTPERAPTEENQTKGKRTLSKKPNNTTDQEDTTKPTDTTSIEDEITETDDTDPKKDKATPSKKRARVIIDDSE
ncbi:hypothetical protein LINPERPRIM_LOCUS35618 [Linum perenne]